MGCLVEYAVTDSVLALAQQGPVRRLFCGTRARTEFQPLHYLDTYDVQVASLPYDRSGRHRRFHFRGTEDWGGDQNLRVRNMSSLTFKEDSAASSSAGFPCAVGIFTLRPFYN